MPSTVIGTKPIDALTRTIKGYGGTSAVARALDVTNPTALNKLRNPESFTVGDLINLSHRLHIPIEELRNSIKA